jgi:hypothetical protein
MFSSFIICYRIMKYFIIIFCNKVIEYGTITFKNKGVLLVLLNQLKNALNMDEKSFQHYHFIYSFINLIKAFMRLLNC